MNLELTIQAISKAYNSGFFAVRDFSITLNQGIIGLLGPNGAGKSSLMRILATISQPTSGTVLWNGVNVQEKPDMLRATLGYLPQSFGVYPNLNAVEFLSYIAALKGIEKRAALKRIDELLQFLNLYDARLKPLGAYSGGMRQRIGIAQALLNDPKLLIVDEPTVGLDPEERMRFRNLITDLAADRIIILSTHIVSDVEASATEIIIMNHGHILSKGRPEALLQSIDHNVWTFLIPSEEFIAARQKYLISGSLRQKEGIQLRVISKTTPHPQAIIVTPTLEDVYLDAISAQRSGGN